MGASWLAIFFPGGIVMGFTSRLPAVFVLVFGLLIAPLKAEPQQNLPTRTYHLDHISNIDAHAIIEPLLSAKGAIHVVPTTDADPSISASSVGSDSGIGNEGLAAGTGENAKAVRRMLIVQDDEDVLRKVDAAIDGNNAQPISVLLEVTMVEVCLTKDHADSGVNLNLIDEVEKTTDAAAKVGGVQESRPVLLKGRASDFVRALNHYGKTWILASPRLLVLNRQYGDVHVGSQLGYPTSTTNSAGTTTKGVAYANLGPEMRVQPFVMPDGKIRLNCHVGTSSGHLDQRGIPQLNSISIAFSAIMPDGATVVMGGAVNAEVQQDRGISSLVSWIPGVRGSSDNTKTIVKAQLLAIVTANVWKPECPIR